MDTPRGQALWGSMRLRPWIAAVALLTAVAPEAGAKQRLIKLTMGPFRIEAKRDREVCQVVRIPDVPPGTQLVSWEARSRVRRRGAVGSHHLVAYGYTGTGRLADFPRGIVDSLGCVDIGPVDFFTRRVFLAGSGGEFQRGAWTVTRAAMPGKLAQVLPSDGSGGAVVVLNSHYFNGSPRASSGLIKVALRLAPLAADKKVLRQVIHLEASRDILVPPGGRQTVTSTFQADGAPNFSTEGGANPSGDVCVFTLTTHMHKRGTRFTIDYEDDGFSRNLLDWPDYLHPGTWLIDNFRPDQNAPGLLRAYTAANGFPRVRYACTHANGVGRVEVKRGCEDTPGVVPGIPWYEAEVQGIPINDAHARPCGHDGINCEGRPCVDANLVFGPLSDDDMCVLTALVFDPAPGVPAEQACSVY